MRILTTDPISGKDITDTTHAPSLVEGSGEGALKIYFDSEANLRAYLDIEIDRPGRYSVAAYNRTTAIGREM